MILQTRRLVLRDLTSDDLDALASFYGDPEVMRFIGEGETRTRDETARHIPYFQQLQREQGYALWAAALRDTDALVGRCGLLTQDLDGERHLEIAYLIGRQFWGLGYASEAAAGIRDWAFAHLGVPRLIALIRPENGASIRVAEKTGLSRWKDIERRGAQLHVFAIERSGA